MVTLTTLPRLKYASSAQSSNQFFRRYKPKSQKDPRDRAPQDIGQPMQASPRWSRQLLVLASNEYRRLQFPEQSTWETGHRELLNVATASLEGDMILGPSTQEHISINCTNSFPFINKTIASYKSSGQLKKSEEGIVCWVLIKAECRGQRTISMIVFMMDQAATQD
jgi:hypothetical protein